MLRSTSRRTPRTLPAMDLALADDLGADDEDVVRAARAEDLTRRLRDSPGDDAIADELAALLEDLGRGHELVALIAGAWRMPRPRGARLAREARTVFERMARRPTWPANPPMRRFTATHLASLS